MGATKEGCRGLLTGQGEARAPATSAAASFMNRILQLGSEVSQQNTPSLEALMPLMGPPLREPPLGTTVTSGCTGAETCRQRLEQWRPCTEWDRRAAAATVASLH